MSVCITQNEYENQDFGPSDFDISVERMENFDKYILKSQVTKKGLVITMDTPKSSINRKIELILKQQGKKFVLVFNVFGKKYNFYYKRKSIQFPYETYFRYVEGKDIIGELKDETIKNEMGQRKVLTFMWRGKKFEFQLDTGGEDRNCISQECDLGFGVYTDFLKDLYQIDGKLRI